MSGVCVWMLWDTHRKRAQDEGGLDAESWKKNPNIHFSERFENFNKIFVQRARHGDFWTLEGISVKNRKFKIWRSEEVTQYTAKSNAVKCISGNKSGTQFTHLLAKFLFKFFCFRKDSNPSYRTFVCTRFHFTVLLIIVFQIFTISGPTKLVLCVMDFIMTR